MHFTRLLDNKQWKLLWHQQWAIVGYKHSAHGYASGAQNITIFCALNVHTRVTTMCVCNNGIIVDVIIASQRCSKDVTSHFGALYNVAHISRFPRQQFHWIREQICPTLAKGRKWQKWHIFEKSKMCLSFPPTSMEYQDFFIPYNISLSRMSVRYA